MTVSGASSVVERTESENFRVYYNDPIGLKLWNSASRDSDYVTNDAPLHGEVTSRPRSISINIIKQAGKFYTDNIGPIMANVVFEGIESDYKP